MAITNTSKPSTTFTNSVRVEIGETWDSIPTTWASETRTWAQLASIITNSGSLIGALWSVKRFPWQELLPWGTDGNITNVAKP